MASSTAGRRSLAVGSFGSRSSLGVALLDVAGEDQLSISAVERLTRPGSAAWQIASKGAASTSETFGVNLPHNAAAIRPHQRDQCPAAGARHAYGYHNMCAGAFEKARNSEETGRSGASGATVLRQSIPSISSAGLSRRQVQRALNDRRPNEPAFLQTLWRKDTGRSRPRSESSRSRHACCETRTPRLNMVGAQRLRDIRASPSAAPVCPRLASQIDFTSGANWSIKRRPAPTERDGAPRRRPQRRAT